MSYLNERIREDGIVINEDVLKIDSFLNHQIDPKVMDEISNEFYATFKDSGITKVLTIEASGIAPAIMVADRLNVPMLFAKKTVPSTAEHSGKYVSKVHSFTKNVDNDVFVSKEYLAEDDVVLIIDDFLATGEAAIGLVDIVHQAGAKVAAVGICVEKAFQHGRDRIEETGVKVVSISRIASLANHQVTFVGEED